MWPAAVCCDARGILEQATEVQGTTPCKSTVMMAIFQSYVSKTRKVMVFFCHSILKNPLKVLKYL